MLKPTDDEFKLALTTAEDLREHGDPQFLGKSLLYLHERNTLLERVYHAAVNFAEKGMFPSQHTELTKAIAAMKNMEKTDDDLPI